MKAKFYSAFFVVFFSISAMVMWFAKPTFLERSLASVWPRQLPPLAMTGKNYKRTIIHIHSNYSHDACDNKPFVNGAPNEPCFQDLLKSFCDLSTDIVFVTEHAEPFINHPFSDAWRSQPNDIPILEDGKQTGIIRTCTNGHRVHIYLGAENNLMPIGLIKHPDTLPNLNLNDTYQARGSDGVQVFREAGATVGVAHTEEDAKTVSYLKQVGIDFLEIYNTHAEFKILRDKKSYFAMLKRMADIFSFANNSAVEPDLVFLTMQTENQQALEKWAQVALSQHITGTAGTDAHQNTFSRLMPDGERIDSYRRMQRWFSNYVNVPDSADRSSVLKAIRDGKNLVVFEVYGIPDGFDFEAQTNQGLVQMGDMMSANGQKYTVRMQMPKLTLGGQATESSGQLRGRILKATEKGWEQVAESKSSTIEFQATEPGVYRAEVRVRPTHLAVFLSGMTNLLDEEYVWIYSNPIWIQ